MFHIKYWLLIVDVCLIQLPIYCKSIRKGELMVISKASHYSASQCWQCLSRPEISAEWTEKIGSPGVEKQRRYSHILSQQVHCVDTDVKVLL